MTTKDNQYVVTRTFQSPRKLRTYHITVGPFATRAKALAYMRRSIRDGYTESELSVGLFRQPGTDMVEVMETWGD